MADVTRRGLLGATALCLAMAISAQAAKPTEPVKIGEAGPAFTGLKSVEGKSYSLADFENKDAVVLVFTCNHCPVAQSYNERFNEFVADYKDKPVGFLAISVSNEPSDNFEAMKKFAQQENLKFPYAHDETQKSGKAYGATVTPHVFILDKERKLAYVGAWDDNWQNPDKVEKTYARDAVEALLAGRTPDQQKTLAKGCGITYE